MATTESAVLSESATRIMGVLNVTPDSFCAASRVADASVALDRARDMARDGAHLVDIGAESSRPGSEPVGLETELARVLPVLEALRDADLSCEISIDTWRAETARRAVARGATMVNDITALRGDSGMAEVVAGSGVDVVLMHMRGDPRTMQDAPEYEDIVDDICAFFEERLRFATHSGIAEDRIWLDPGFGFGKTVRHNLDMLRRLGEFQRFGRPVLVGASNKSTIGTVLGVGVDDRTEGTAATVAVAVMNGAKAVRVHDVRAMARVARMCDAVMGRFDGE